MELSRCLSADVRPSPDLHLVLLSGDVDEIAAEPLRLLLSSLSSATVVVDLADVRAVDTVGAMALVNGKLDAEARRQRLALHRAGLLVRQRFALLGLGHLLEDDPGARMLSWG